MLILRTGTGYVFITTPDAPTAPSGLAATAGSSTQINLGWTDNSNNETGFIIQRSADGTTGWTQVGTALANATTSSDTGLSPSTAYFYRVLAAGVGGNSTPSNTASASTASGGGHTGSLTAPTISTLVQGADAQTSMTVTWTDPDTNVDSFLIYREDGWGSYNSDVSYNLVGTVAAGTFVFADGGQTPNTEYFYKVAASNATGVSGRSAYANAATAAETTPVTPSAAAAVAYAPTRVATSWDNPSVVATDVFVERSPDGVTYSPLVQLTPIRANNYLDATASPSTTYHYRVRNFNSFSGQYSPYTTPFTATTPASQAVPSAVTSLSVSSAAPHTASLVWSNGDVFRVEDYFTVERSIDGGSTYTQVAKPWRGVTGYFDAGLTPGQSGVVYRVKAHNASGASAPTVSSPLTMPSSNGATVPGTPTNVTAVAADDTRVSVQWSAADTAADGFVVEQSADGGSTWTFVASVPKRVTQVYATGLTAATAYRYRVRAFSGGGASSNASPGAGGVLNAQPLQGNPVTTLGTGLVLSPAGRNPVLGWTPQQFNVWKQMQTDFNASAGNFAATVYGQLKSNADRCLVTPPNNLDQDWGFSAGILYQITGDTSYALGALATAFTFDYFDGVLAVNPNGNQIREWFIEMVQLYDWIKSGIDSTARSRYLADLRTWVSYSFNWDGQVGGWRWGTETTDTSSSALDDDQNTAQYLALCMMDVALEADVPEAGTFTHRLTSTGNHVSRMGGLFPTGLDRTTGSDTIGETMPFCSRGGEWLTQSSEYGPGTSSFVATAIEAVRTARSAAGDNTEYWPALREAVLQTGLFEVHRQTPDGVMPVGFGDVQDPRSQGASTTIIRRQSHWGGVAGLGKDQPDVGPFLLDKVKTVFNGGIANNPNTYAGNVPYVRFYYHLDPYRATSSPATAERFALGQGSVLYHDDWTDTSSSLFALVTWPRTDCDHEVNYLTSFQIYRKNEWALTHPLGYGIQNWEGEVVNGMLIGGLSSARADAPGNPHIYNGFRGPVAHESGTGPPYSYSAGMTWGQYYLNASYLPPPEFIHEWTRSYLYLPSPDKKSDTVLVVDRTLASNPNFLPTYVGSSTAGLDNYLGSVNANSGLSDVQRIQRATALKEWILHCPVDPTVTGSTVTWATTGGQDVRCRTLLPASPVIVSYQENITLLPGVGTLAESDPERKWQFRVTPPTAWPTDATPTWDVFLHSVQVYDSGATVDASLVQSVAADKVAGFRVTRATLHDTLALFSVVPSARNNTTRVTTFNRVLASGFTVTWAAVASSTDVILADMDPAKSWSYALDGGGSNSLAVSANGVGKFTITGTGSHTLVFTAS